MARYQRVLGLSSFTDCRTDATRVPLHRDRSRWRRRAAAAVIALGYVCINLADAYLLNSRIALVWIGWPATLYCFLHFWAIMPLVGKMESIEPLPDSIAKPVLASTIMAD